MTVSPSSTADELLLINISELLIHILLNDYNNATDSITWLVDMTLNQHGAINGVINTLTENMNGLSENVISIKR